MIKKILYLGFHFDYGKKENGIALNYKGWFENFKELGYEIEGVHYDEYEQLSLHKKLISILDQNPPDMVFFILQNQQVNIDTLKYLKDRSILTVGFFGDDQWRFSQLGLRDMLHIFQYA
jgi:hypothetical protein